MKKLLSTFFFLFPFFLISQTTQLSDRPFFNATLLSSDPLIDGNILSDELWKTVPVIDKMIQTKPLFGMESSEKTEIRIAFTNTTFYLGVVCYDSSPNTLVVSDSRRDSDLNDDQVRVLDPFEAITEGASRLVVGRPITNSHDPAGAFERFVKELNCHH